MALARVAAATDVGCVRSANQDEFLLGRLGEGMFSARSCTEGVSCNGLVIAVADGMGGMPDGDLASRLAVEAVSDRVGACALGGEDLSLGAESFHEQRRRILQGFFIEAHSRIVAANRGRQPHLMMGTTLTLALFAEDSALIGNVGDSRMYLLRKGQARAVTTDQTVASFLLRYGHISEEEARNHPERKILAQALGHGSEIELDIEHVDLLPGDVLLGCSDGLTDLVDSEEILKLAADHRVDADLRLQNLVQLAKARGGHDNITIVLLDYLAA